MTNQKIQINDEVFTFPRLDAEEREQVLCDFAWERLGEDANHEEFDDFITGCTVLYRDNHATGQTWYQVVDAQGHGDGSGVWTPLAR